MNGLSTKIVIVLAVAVLGFLTWQTFVRDDFDLPVSGDSKEQQIVVSPDGDLIESDQEEVKRLLNQENGSEFSVRIIMITDGLKHSVPLNEIVGGGPPKDGIPSIDDPKFVSVAEVDFLDDSEPGIAVTLGGVSRFYPFQILVWHEMVNDTIGGQRVLITYCPLCLSGIVFDPEVRGERVEFGTSGKLWNSNLVMYDRKTDSLWSQILGEAIAGEMTGQRLKVLPSDQLRFGEWKSLNPSGQVLSRETGVSKFYGLDPYGDYYSQNGVIYSRVNNRDSRLEDKDFVLGVVIEGSAKAYLASAVKSKGKFEDVIGTTQLVVEYQKDIDAVRIFRKIDGGKLERINPIPNFWFSWVAVYPDTQVFK